MVRIISFEGCVGAGKTSLTNYFSHELGLPKVLEQYDRNPFLPDFYAGKDVKLETEITFLLQHYSQLKDITRNRSKAWVLADFTIEKDLVYAKLNLNRAEFKLFNTVYGYVTSKVGIPDVVIYIDLSLKVLRRRIFQRGRPYEMSANAGYFKDFNDRVKQFFKNESKSEVYFFDVDDLELEEENPKLSQIRCQLSDIQG